MSSLMLSQDLHIMMLEVAVDNVLVARKSIFDEVILKKTSLMFRMLDEDWTVVFPNEPDGKSSYRGDCRQLRHFHAGKSTIFALPSSALRSNIVEGIDVQFYVRQEMCKHFEMDPCESVGFASLNVDHLFNHIIKQLGEREQFDNYLGERYRRQPISSSFKCKCPLMDEDVGISDSTLELYIRISYLGNCVITDILVPEIFQGKSFLAHEQTNPHSPYHFSQISLKPAKTFDLPAPPNSTHSSSSTDKKNNKRRRRSKMSNNHNQKDNAQND